MFRVLLDNWKILSKSFMVLNRYGSKFYLLIIDSVIIIINNKF